jgi:hypothetical protein
MPSFARAGSASMPKRFSARTVCAFILYDLNP